ncbi:hypothetical protein M8C21_005735 [Ambrosia artemisiifolia]|uniref:RRM domain-containing protein n=1 Tax=Ambrosia artemisiifolia TaxID=4212 RepID=A0AAD5CQW9_AMBAR|nr:hypothetical protein M8C21_005735 [Ambrosia artemisiifolia]
MMTDYEQNNGEDVQPFAAVDSSPPPAANSHGAATEDFSDSKSQRGSRDYERESSKSRRRDREDRPSRHRSRSRSHSRAKSERRSRSRSRSRSKSKRVSGFDMAPPASAILAGAAAVTAVWKGHTKMHGVILSHTHELRELLVLSCVLVPGPSPAVPGMFQNMFPLASGQFGALPVMPVQAMTQQATRHARRVYVGGLSPSANEQTVATFFSHVMSAIGGNTAGPVCVIGYACICDAVLNICRHGAPVKVRRPSDYNPSLAATLGPSQPNPNLNLGAVGLNPGSAGGLEGPDRIFVGGLPYYFTEAQVRELLESFGALRGFDLVKDRETGNSKGYAFCVYQDLSVTDIACAALNGIKMGDKTLTVRRANQGQIQPKPEQESVLLHAQQQIALQRMMLQPGAISTPPTKVLSLTQVVTEEELVNDEEYEDILEDMKTECGKFGSLVNVVIPRPNPNGEPVAGVGKVFLEYADTESSTKARAGLNGRKFGGNQVAATFYPENKFNQGECLYYIRTIEGPDCIFVGGLPYYFTDANVRELLESFGPLRGFVLVKDRETDQNSKRNAFCVYQDPFVTDVACAALNGIQMGDTNLTVRRANQDHIALQRLTLEQPETIGTTPTKVVYLTGMVTEEELVNDEEYEDILEDMKIECRKFGSLVNVVIPRPNTNGEPVAGVGKVFLEYADTESSTKAWAGLNGRNFVGRKIVASFYPENKFNQGEYDGERVFGFDMGPPGSAILAGAAAVSAVWKGRTKINGVILIFTSAAIMSGPWAIRSHSWNVPEHVARLMLQPEAIGTHPTKVVSLTQLVTEEDLINDEEYEDILEDMEIECGQFGSLVNVVIPRPNPNGEPVAGVGNVFVEYADTESSMKARAGLNGRKFGGNQVVASFYQENKFNQGEYDG